MEKRSTRAPFLAGQHAIEAYGSGGFRFADMSHRGSLLSLPSGIHAWDVSSPAEFTIEAFAPVASEAASIELLLIGTGEAPAALDEALMWHLRGCGFRVDMMTTAAAARTYNILLSEQRRAAAALVAVP